MVERHRHICISVKQSELKQTKAKKITNKNVRQIPKTGGFYLNRQLFECYIVRCRCS